MADATSELLLRITGDGSGGADALDSVSQAAIRSSQGISDAFSAASDQASSAIDALGTHAASAFDGVPAAAQAAADQTTASVQALTDQTTTTWRGMWDDLTTRTYTAVSEIGTSMSGLGETVKSAIEDPMAAAGESIKSVLEELGPFGVGLAAIGTAGAAAGVGLFELASSSAETVEGIRDFSVMTGMSVDQVDRLRSIATIAGSSLEQMQGLAFRLQTQLQATGAAGDKFAAGLADLNINASDFRNADLTTQVLMLSQGFNEGANSGNNMAAAVDVLGTRGRQYLPMLTKDLSDISAQADAAGLHLSQAAIEGAEKFNQNVHALDLEWQNLKVTLGTPIVAAINWVFSLNGRALLPNEISWFLDFLSKAQQAKADLANPASFLNAQHSPFLEQFSPTDLATMSAPALATAQPAGVPTISAADAKAQAQYWDDLVNEQKKAQAALAPLTAAIDALTGVNKNASVQIQAVSDVLHSQDIIISDSDPLYTKIAGEIDTWSASSWQLTSAQQAALAPLQTWLESTRELTIRTQEQNLAVTQGIDPMQILGVGTHVMATASEDGSASLADLNPRVISISDAVKILSGDYSTNIDYVKQYPAQLGFFSSNLYMSKDALDALWNSTVGFNGALSVLSSGLRTLASTSSGTFKAMATDLENAVNGWKEINKAISEYDTYAQHNNTLGEIGSALGGVSAALGVLQAVQPVLDMISNGLDSLFGLTSGDQFMANIQAYVTSVQDAGKAWDSYASSLAAAMTPQERLTADMSDTNLGLAGLEQRYQNAGLSASEAAQQAQTDWNDLQQSVYHGAAATQQAIDTINARLQALQTDQQNVASGVSGMVSAFQNAGEYIPKAMRESIEQLASMPGLTDAEKTSLDGLVSSLTPSFNDLMTVAGKYNLTLAQLGPTFQQQDLESKAKSLYDDFTELTEQGADVGGVLDGMKGSFQDLVTESLTAGAKIPDNLKPMLQALVDAGDLTDASGKKLSDLSGISFENSPVDTTLQNLTDLISGPTGLQNVLATLSYTISHLPDHTVDIGLNIQAPNGLSIPGYAWNPATGQFDPIPGYTYGTTNPFAAGQNAIAAAFGNLASGAQQASGTTTPAAATGGLVTFTGIEHFALGGYTGIDSILAAVAPQEIILNPNQQSAVAALMARSGVGPDGSINANGTALDTIAQVLAKTTLPAAPSIVIQGPLLNAPNAIVRNRSDMQDLARDLGDALMDRIRQVVPLSRVST